MIKNRLNEFEADWAAMPQVEKEKLNQLQHKTILVSGHSLARCLCYALVYQSEQQNRDIRVVYAGDCSGFYLECTESQFFTALDFYALGELKHVDYIVHTGFCGEESDCFPRDFAEEVRRVNLLAAFAEQQKAKVVLLSAAFTARASRTACMPKMKTRLWKTPRRRMRSISCCAR